MPDTDLIVPVRLRTLIVTRQLGEGEFTRWTPDFGRMLNEAQSPEPLDARVVTPMDGVHIQWELPEALARGHYDAATGETSFPLVPNRWLVVRYSNGTGGVRQAKGWVVHSDYLPLSDYGDSWQKGTSWYLTDRSADGGAVPLHLDKIGRHHELTVTDPWTDPEPEEYVPFLTAIGPGLPAFAAFASYHMDVFCFHDTLKDLADAGGSHYAPDNDLSYAVIGWYSHPGADILKRAADIPCLLPPKPGAPEEPDTSMEAVLRALGWSANGDSSQLTDTRYYGTALHIPWRYNDPAPISRKPTNDKVTLAVGHSTADAAAELISRQTRSEQTGELVKALFNGTIETYGLPDGAVELDEATRRAWYAGSEGGHLWQIVPDPDRAAPEQLPQIPAWLDELNRAQAEYDERADRLARMRARLWDVWWLKNLPVAGNGQHPPGFDEEARRQLAPSPAGTLAAQVKADLDRLAALRQGENGEPGLPVGNTPEQLEERIAAYAQARDLPEELLLKRGARDPYHSPADPVVVIGGSGASQPLSRDADDPLPCRLPSALLESITINGTPTRPDPTAPKPNLAGLPTVCATLIAEFALLDKAAWTPAGPDITALEVALGDPDSMITGALPEYTGMWEQPWTPMYLQWNIRYCATPFRTGSTDNWSFDGTRYSWEGTNALSLGGDEHLWPVFQGRSFLAPTTAYVLREQAKRYLNTFSPAEAQGLSGLLDYYAELDVLSQTLDGFNDWLLEQDGTARLVPSPEDADEDADPELFERFGDALRVPQPDLPGRPDQGRFQPVRAGQFYFNRLQMIDRFGRTFDFMALNSEDPASMQPQPEKAGSVRPDPTKPLYTKPGLPKPNDDWRFIQLTPRLMQPARVRLEAVRARDDAAYPGLPSVGDPGQTPVVGWLMLNYLDRTILVYAPDGAPLGELRVVGEGTGLAWTVLPHASHGRPSDQDFRDDFPQLAAMLTALLDHEDAPGAFEALVHTIDQSLQSVTDRSPQTDRSPARLIGRPVALVRAELEVQLQGPPLTTPAWGKILVPERAEYLDYHWPVRLGSPELLTDGLIGYYASGQGPGTATDYARLSIVAADLATHPYLTPITNGTDLALPATPSDTPPVIHHLTLLADPHAAIHATTDILPVADLTLDSDLVQQALTRIEASFRLDPLLAPTRAGEQTATASPGLGEAPGHHLAHLLDGNLGSHYLSEHPAAQEEWIELDLGGDTEEDITHVDVYPGDPMEGHPLPACVLETFTEATGWTEHATYPAGTEIHYTPAAPVTAARIRIRFTAPSTQPIAIRSFTATTNAGDNGIVMPRPAAWFGNWTWAEPLAQTTGVPNWARLPILPADKSAYLDDPVPTARAGYLQLRPRHD
ncbi:discoidin domain-containing protein [Kitasatospora sp. NPDC004669]|uniref:discoidin domain-containing protein n=1 Tax=Kitasatospora sp. NPDC004669 TaxID=3154555 RepID=UPI0033AC7D0A